MLRSLAGLWGLLSRRQRWQAGGLAVLLLGNSLLEMVGVGLVPVYVGMLANPGGIQGSEQVVRALGALGLDPSGMTPGTLLFGGTAVLFGIFTIKLVLAPLIAWIRARYVQSVVHSQGVRLFEGYMRSPYEFHLARNSAELIRNISMECARLGDTVLNPLVGTLSQLLITLAIVGLLVATVPVIALLTLAGTGAVVVPLVAALSRRTRRLAASAQDGRARVIQATQEGLGGVKELQLLHREEFFVARFRAALRQVLDLQRFLQVINTGLPVLMEWTGVVAMLIVVVTLYRPGQPEGTLLGVVALFAVAMARLKGSVTGVLSGYAQVRANAVSVDTVVRDLRAIGANGSGDRRALPGSATVGRLPFAREIVIDDLWFRYASRDRDALRGISLTVRKGEAVGIVGPSGGGKSTFVDLVLGILTPTRSAIRVDGVDIRTDPARWQRTVGYVPQSLFLVDGTIRQNVALGVEDAAVDGVALQRALAAANLDSLVRELPDGLDTRIGERGLRLSGGQRQRIAIARSLYDDPGVLVMDEATSALDNLSERAVMEAVESLKGERTILIIAHRLSTVRHCDRIVYLSDGRIEGIGTYADLAATHHGFRRLAEVR